MGTAYYYHADGSLPKLGEIFVFGSNLAGIHGAGAALVAYRHYGAKFGKGVGLSGTSYALPTKDKQIKSLPLRDIKGNVETFLEFAKEHDKSFFFITRIGCGLAGFKDSQIAPMFLGAPTNCSFPSVWKKYIE
jgi:hypothetical protein